MTLWTIQPISVFEELKKEGVFRCNPSLAENIVDEFNFKDSYDWLISEMENYIGKKPIGVSYPIWAWHTRNWKHRKPDLREAGYEKRGNLCVLLEIEKPDKEVLLSDFDAWHFVLNNWYLGDSRNEEEWNKEDDWFEKLDKQTQNELKLKSWQKIFDVSPFKSDWTSKGCYIQANFWELSLNEVKGYQIFKAK